MKKFLADFLVFLCFMMAVSSIVYMACQRVGVPSKHGELAAIGFMVGFFGVIVSIVRQK